MSIHVPRVPSFFLGFWHHFVLAKLATSSIRVKTMIRGVTYQLTAVPVRVEASAPSRSVHSRGPA